jgi:hypothetical protein
MQHTPQQKAQKVKKTAVRKRGKTAVPSDSFGVRAELIIDKATLRGLDDDARYLHQILTAQALDTALKLDITKDIFDFVGEASVYVNDIIDLLRNDWLDVSIVQIFCM